MLVHFGKILHDLGENEMAFVLFVLFRLSTGYLPVDVPKTSRLTQDVLFGFSPWDDPQKIGLPDMIDTFSTYVLSGFSSCHQLPVEHQLIAFFDVSSIIPVDEELIQGWDISP
jgi:hypothetical protein